MNLKSFLVLFLFASSFAACGKDATSNSVNSITFDTGSNGPDGGSPEDMQTRDDGGGPNNIGTDGGPIGDSGPGGSTTVTTTAGPVDGVEEDGIVSFKGIAYAEPPIGDLRFRPPVAHGGWDAARDASAFGSSCPQRDLMSGNNFGDEDCLFLNVWAPSGAQDRPVMVFVHGGAFVQGESSNPLYDGTHLAGMDVVVVTLNYRLGPLGFLAVEELAADSADDTAGAYGMLDQVLALEWVQDNVAAFGGDPSNVTIFGESAGGVSVCGHLGSPLSEGLFSRAIIESGSGCGNYAQLRTGTLTRNPAVMTGAQYVAEVGCSGAADVVQCLRDVPALDTVTAAWALGATALGLPPFGMIIDGTFLDEQPIERFRDGSARDVPIMTGSNADEATIFTSTTPVPTQTAYQTIVRTLFGTTIGNQVLAIYPATDFDSPKDAYNALFSDVSFICPALRFAGVAASGPEPAHTYHLTHVLPGVAGALGAFHGLDLFYVFGTFAEASPNYTPDADDLAIRDAMMGAWTGFAADGSLPWPAHDRLNPSIQIFDNPAATVTQIREGRCVELDAIGAF